MAIPCFEISKPLALGWRRWRRSRVGHFAGGGGVQQGWPARVAAHPHLTARSSRPPPPSATTSRPLSRSKHEFWLSPHHQQQAILSITTTWFGENKIKSNRTVLWWNPIRSDRVRNPKRSRIGSPSRTARHDSIHCLHIRCAWFQLPPLFAQIDWLTHT